MAVIKPPAGVYLTALFTIFEMALCNSLWAPSNLTPSGSSKCRTCGSSPSSNSALESPLASDSMPFIKLSMDTWSLVDGKVLPSSCERMSKSLTNSCILSACTDIRVKYRARSSASKGRLCRVSINPLMTVKGVLISWETLATKSRLISSACATAVTSRVNSSCLLSP